MRKGILVVALAIFSVSLVAQEEEVKEAKKSKAEQVYDNQPRKQKEVKTLFGPNRGNGGYGAISMGYTQIDGGNAIVMGGRGEWIIGHGLGLGIGGNAFVNDPLYVTQEDLYYSLAGGYGGFIIEPILMGRWPVHLSFPIMLGAGGVALTTLGENVYGALESTDAYFEGASAFFVAEPSIELELNLVKWMRMAFYGSYRYTSDIVLTNSPFSPQALNGWSAGITFKVGGF